jgi:hypothetical protein
MVVVIVAVARATVIVAVLGTTVGSLTMAGTTVVGAPVVSLTVVSLTVVGATVVGTAVVGATAVVSCRLCARRSGWVICLSRHVIFRRLSRTGSGAGQLS